MIRYCTGWLIVGILLTGLHSRGQTVLIEPDTTNTPGVVAKPTQRLRDVADAAHSVARWIAPHDSARLQEGGKFVWIIPQLGYTLQTNLLAQVLVNAAFHQPGANMSSLNVAGTYTQNKQAIFAANSSIWLRDNGWNWTNDWRLMHYPQSTYGLGMYTSTTDERQVRNMDYSYLRLYQSLLRRVTNNLYAGAGYQLDLHWDISTYNRFREFTRISRYTNGIEGRSVSSGPVLQVVYDNRRNSINPMGGFYLNATWRSNLQALGSDNTYQSLLVEARRYLHLSPSSENVLALWSYNWLTLNGDPPFLDLPSTGWDAGGNVGRGFIQGRFRGKRFLYVETEYRFRITADRLLGGVVFANATTVTEPAPTLGQANYIGPFKKVVPAVGAGLRLKMNKFSRTNLCIDYGFGLDGSHGLFFNLGEVF